MSLVGKHESPLLDPEPLLLQTEVLPMLDDIISRGRASSLKHSEFPKKWRDEQSTQMDQFIQRYNDYLTNQRYCCSKCNRLCVESGGQEWAFQDPQLEYYGTQNIHVSNV